MTAKPEIGTTETLPVPIGPRVLASRLNFTDQLAFAKTLLDTGFLPSNLRTSGQVLAVILTGQEMGIGPMQALRSIGIINGKPVIAADLQLALFHRAGGQSKWTLLTEKEATIWLKHPGGSEHTETFTLDDAKRAGLVRAGGNYEKFPKAMLRSRAITAGLKSVGFEPTCGVYDPEELDPEPTKYEPPTAKELTEVPVPLRAPEPPLPYEERPAGVSAEGEVLDEGPTRETPYPGPGPTHGKTVKDWAKNQLVAAETSSKLPEEWRAVVRSELKARSFKDNAAKT